MIATSSMAEVSSAHPRRAGRWAWRLLLVALLVLIGYEVGRRLVGLNLHTVLPGQVFRGAQPSPRFIRELARDYGVRTIINLRGCGTPALWYANQVRTVQEEGIAQEDISFSALRLPSSMELRRLVDVLDRVEYPVYIHCRRGADRTGLAAVIVKLLRTDQDFPLAEARRQLGLWYGHVALGKTQVLDQFFDLYEDWLDRAGRLHDPATFRHWVLEEYRGGWCSARIEEVTPLDREARAGQPLGYRVTIRNTGVRIWRLAQGSRAGMHVGYQVWDGAACVAEGRAGMFNRAVPPGESVTVTLVVKPLARSGRFRLLVDMVEEQHCWFYQAGSEPYEEELVIRD